MRSLALLVLLVPQVAYAIPNEDPPPPLTPALSAQLALGVGTELHVHAWFGAGIHDTGSGSFALLGMELDSYGDTDTEAEPGATEWWMSARIGLGTYTKPHYWIPVASVYFLGAVRVSGPEEAPRLRLGMGGALAALLPLAEIGIPNSVEVGLDVGDEPRGWLHLGWTF